MNAAAHLDLTLLHPRTVLWAVPDAQGVGFEIKLECGHLIWMSVKPILTLHCGVCLEELKKQAARIQAHQEPR